MIDFADLEAVDICPRRDNLSRLRLLPDTHYVKSPYSTDKIGCLAFRRLQKIREKFIQCFQNSLIKGFFPPNKFVILALLLNIGVD